MRSIKSLYKSFFTAYISELNIYFDNLQGRNGLIDTFYAK